MSKGEALESYHGVEKGTEVRFGNIQGMTKYGEELIITDMYRHGIWGFNPKNGKIRVIAGMRSNSNYHYGGFVGNAGLSASELRLGGLQFLRFNKEMDIFLVPTQYGRSIIAMSGDLKKTIELIPDTEIQLPQEAIFIDKNTIAVSDSSANKVHLFQLPNLDKLLN